MEINIKLNPLTNTVELVELDHQSNGNKPRVIPVDKHNDIVLTLTLVKWKKHLKV